MDMLTQVDIDPLLEGNNENINAHLKTDQFDLPLLFRVGVAMNVLKNRGNSNLILAIDALHPNNDLESINIGAEYALNDMYFLRSGYNTMFAIDSESGLSLGGGLAYKFGNSSLIFDNAYQDWGILNSVQVFTVGLKL